MRQFGICVAIAATATTLSAQAPAPTQNTPWEVAAGVGANFRSERGHTLGGARFEGALRRPWNRSANPGGSWLEFGAALAQVTAHFGPTGNGANVNENSVEFFARLDRTLFSHGAWSLTGSLGPAVAVSVGCTGGGSFAADAVGYGAAKCTNDFANKGTVRPGLTARLTNEWRGPRAAFTVATELGAGTIAAANGASLAILVGFRAPVR